MASVGSNWYFSKEQLENSPSKQCGIDCNKELSFRQQAANFIQEMGQKLKVTQLCINTAIVYMHRFYVFHSFTRFPWNTIAAAAVLLAAKVEEQPRKLEHVIRVVNLCKNPNDKTFDTTSEKYSYQLQDLIFNENILLQTLGFEVAIDHPHTHVVRCCHLVRATKDLAHTSYFMASNSLHLTTMCLQYKPTVVACFCIHFVCKWANWEIPLSNEKKQWFSYVDETVTSEILEQLANDFLLIYENCPSRLKEKIVALGEGLSMPQNAGPSASPFDSDKKPVTFSSSESNVQKIRYSEMKSFTVDEFKHRALKQQAAHNEATSSGQHHNNEREHKDKKEREHASHHFKPPLTSSSSTSSKHVFDNHQPVDPGKPNKVVRPQPTQLQNSVVKSENKEGPVKNPGNSANLNRNSSNTTGNSIVSKRPTDPNKSRPRDDSKPYNHKLESDIKKHLSAAINDKIPPNPHAVSHKTIVKVAPKLEDVKVETPVSVKRPSLFSPEKTPPAKRPRTKTPPNSSKRSDEFACVIKRSRTSSTTSTNSTNSEPELRPVMKKIDQVEGFESLMHDSSIGISVSAETKPDVSIAKELKPPDLIPPFGNANVSAPPPPPIINGIETTPSLISNLLKETPVLTHLPVDSKESSHKKNKKEKHKHRSKEKHRDDKEKKRKHKEKDKEKHRHKDGGGSTTNGPSSLKITITKDKKPANPESGFKIKIPKDRIKTDGIGGETSSSSLSSTSSGGGGLKIKISKDFINNFNNNSDVINKKRDRSKDGTSPVHKLYKSNHNRLTDSRKNNSFNQVIQLGDEKSSTLHHKLAESKYISKRTTT